MVLLQLIKLMIFNGLYWLIQSTAFFPWVEWRSPSKLWQFGTYNCKLNFRKLHQFKSQHAKIEDGLCTIDWCLLLLNFEFVICFQFLRSILVHFSCIYRCYPEAIYCWEAMKLIFWISKDWPKSVIEKAKIQ